MVQGIAGKNDRQDREAGIFQEITGCGFEGKSIAVSFAWGLAARRGRLVEGEDAARRGTPVHAAAFLRERRIVLDAKLRKGARRRILVHELFHFAWIRLSNARRADWAALIGSELRARARGELGWSSEWRKAELSSRPGRFFREYLCESFCDTAAWLHGGVRGHDEFTLAPRWRARRRAWFEAAFRGKPVKL